MRKSEFVSAVAKKCDIDCESASKAIDAVTQTIMDALSNGEKVQIIGFGTFDVNEVHGRQLRNLRTGELFMTQDVKTPTFKAGKAFKDAVNKRDSETDDK